tara:strand:+ start:2143 stop:3291 length:1149 start_codon:yes stop_codon:yes gene_type:complete
MINILHLDTEGGWGGSSISLFKIIKNLNKEKFKSTVICRKQGPILKKYKKINIEASRVEGLYSFSAKPEINNFKLFLTTLPELLFIFSGFFKIMKIIKLKKINLIHLNFEGFFLLGLLLKFFTKVPTVVHYRSTIPINSIAHKIISNLVVKYLADFVIFISKTEKKKFIKIYPNLSKYKFETVYNISDNKVLKSNRNYLSKDLVFVGNISYYKGVDRLLDIAKFIKDKSLKIKIYGQTRGEHKFEKFLIKTIKEYKLPNLKLMGRTNKAEKIIQNAFVVLRPSRFNDPWGRDILDAFNAGVPCISTGKFNDLIINKKNGFYVENFEKKRVLKIINRLKSSKNYYFKLQSNIINTQKKILDKSKNIKKIEKIFQICLKKEIIL